MSWEIRFNDRWNMGAIECVIFDRTDAGIVVIEPIKQEIKTRLVKPLDRIGDPTFLIPRYMVDGGLLSSLAEELDRKKIKPPSRSFAEGELRATKIHLDDMRKIFFENFSSYSLTKKGKSK